MASTRSKNTPGDYLVEQNAYKQQIDYKTNVQLIKLQKIYKTPKT